MCQAGQKPQRQPHPLSAADDQHRQGHLRRVQGRYGGTLRRAGDLQREAEQRDDHPHRHHPAAGCSQGSHQQGVPCGQGPSGQKSRRPGAGAGQQRSVLLPADPLRHQGGGRRLAGHQLLLHANIGNKIERTFRPPVFCCLTDRLRFPCTDCGSSAQSPPHWGAGTGLRRVPHPAAPSQSLGCRSHWADPPSAPGYTAPPA